MTSPKTIAFPKTTVFPKIICVDFDGTIHSYTSGWKGACEIPDPPIEGAMGWIVDMTHDSRFDVQIYSSRSKEEGAIEAMKAWFMLHLQNYFKRNTMVRFSEEEAFHAASFVVSSMKFPTQKPPAFLTIDDRAMCFDGTYPTLDEIDSFLTWQKRAK